MEIIKANFVNTSTQLVVNSNTATAENIINPDEAIQYYSDGFNDDNTTTTLTVNFDSTIAVSRLGILGINCNAFTVFYNGATANTFAITSTGATSASDFSTNSEPSMFIQATSVNVTSVSIDMKTTMVANSEKVLGQFIISNEHVVFPRNPSAKNYKPLTNPKQTVHKLSDGGVRIHYVATKRSAEVKYSYITESFRDSLKAVYDLNDSFIFVPFGTMTSWDKIIFDAVWPGAFDFYKYSDNAATTGFSGKIKIKETSI
jgi:hypothetical protein